MQEVIRHSTHAPQIAVNSKQLIHTPWRRAFFPPTHTYNIHMTLFLLLSIIGLFISDVTYNTVYIVYLTEYRLITDNHCVYIHRIVWGFNFSVVIVSILWMSFFSGRLDGTDH